MDSMRASLASSGPTSWNSAWEHRRRVEAIVASIQNGPVLSVVVPTYNRAPLLERTLDSLARQSLARPYEVVVVDDGSTDDTSAVLRSWAARDPRIRPIRSTVNRGRSA